MHWWGFIQGTWVNNTQGHIEISITPYSHQVLWRKQEIKNFRKGDYLLEHDFQSEIAHKMAILNSYHLPKDKLISQATSIGHRPRGHKPCSFLFGDQQGQIPPPHPILRPKGTSEGGNVKWSSSTSYKTFKT
jgi:hypothetical protein